MRKGIYYNPLGVVIESNQNAKRNQRFEILSWRNSYFIEHNLGKKTILEIAGEKKTDAEVLQEKVASSLLLSGIEKAINSTYATIIKVIADIQNNQENNIKLDTSVTNIEVGNYIKTLGLNGNIIYENNNKVFMLNVMVNKVVLNIRVHATTLTIPSSASRAISVGAYDARTFAYADFSGRGFTRLTNMVKPDLVAPGVEVMTTTVGGGYAAFTGTSFATPFVTGSAALLMEWGIVRGNDPYLYGEKVKAYLRRGAKKVPGFDEYPNEEVGYGALCTAQSIPKI